MKNVRIKYNPYLNTTQIEVDGKAPKSDSKLSAASALRLQEWIETLPEKLIEEYRDHNFKIEFTGTLADYNDVVAAISAYGNEINAECIHHATPNIDEVEATIDQIFAEIKANELVPELKAPEIIEAFEKAKDSSFEVNVVATMSSGKSTLINSILQQQLMPAKNEATTATIVKIIDTDSDHLTAVAYDKSGNKVVELDNVALDAMSEINDDERVSVVELRGKIPFVKSTGMRLSIVDTPGPNNSRDKSHQEKTYSMIANSDKSLVLFVMNMEQNGTDDENNLLDYICRQMAKGGKQSRERFIFAFNKVDKLKLGPKGEGEGVVPHYLSKAKNDLEKRGISNPNLFPVASLPALQLRVFDDGIDLEDEEESDDIAELKSFTTRSRKYPEMHLEKYYDFSNLPNSVRNTIDTLLDEISKENEMEDKASRKYSESGRQITEIHTGIVNIEQAINMYVNKYARTQKVMDLVQAFNGKLEEMATIAKVEDDIAKNKEKAAELEKQIATIKQNIASANKAKNLSQEIDKIDLTADAKKELTAYINSVRNQISGMMSGRDSVYRAEAEAMGRDLEKKCRAINAQINVELKKILEKAYKTTLTKIIDEYKKHLATLNIGINTQALSFNPMSLVSMSLSNLNNIIEDNTTEEDEGGLVRREGGFLRKAGSFLTFGLIDDFTEEWQEDIQEKTDMRKVTKKYLEPFQTKVMGVRDSALNHISNETLRLKDHLKKELVKIDAALNSKLDALSQTEASSKATAVEIANNEAKLRWLKEITQRVRDIIDF
ncbi:MAG: hypothetical protein HDS30_06930 [Bacteroides sp.]|nr:hypothetical protein [Bacteroides sp.]